MKISLISFCFLEQPDHVIHFCIFYIYINIYIYIQALMLVELMFLYKTL